LTIHQKKLLDNALKMMDYSGEEDVLRSDCDIDVYLLDNCEITVPEINRFMVAVDCRAIREAVFRERFYAAKSTIRDPAYADGMAAKLYFGTYDFGHTSACWEDVINLGIYGLRQRIDRYRDRAGNDPHKQRFYREITRVYDAALRFIARAAKKARDEGRTEMADGLDHLTKGAPSTLYEALQTVILYYYLQQYFDGTLLRTLGRLDTLLFPFYKKADKAIVPQMLLDFMHEIDRIHAAANMPFALGGTDEQGNDLINELSYLLLETYRKAGTHCTKLHLLISENTPRDIVENALDAVREGNNSIVFMDDGRVIKSLELLGEEHRDAVNYHVVGCYECGANGEITCSCGTRMNLAKALEMALFSGVDLLTGKQIGLANDGVFPTFDDLFSEYLRQVKYAVDCGIYCTDLCEENYGMLHAAPIFSATYVSALENGGDLYCDHSAKYPNSSVDAIGLATATDSLAAIRKLVYEDKSLTLDEFKAILKNNWEGQEVLRLTVKNKFPKYGMGDKKTDDLAKKTVDALAAQVNGHPNKKGGVYRLGLFSIDWRWKFGSLTGASADGRLSGETVSQNTGATFGADRNGATAHMLSVAYLDGTRTPNGAIVDLDLHSSAVRGENGLNAMTASLYTFLALGGFCIHYNVLDTETLKKAKDNPEAYPNLQVRLCGWNVLFSSLSEKEKEEFIARSESAGMSA